MYYLKDITSFRVGNFKLRCSILHGSDVFHTQESKAHALGIAKKLSSTAGAGNWPVVPRFAKNTGVNI